MFSACFSPQNGSNPQPQLFLGRPAGTAFASQLQSRAIEFQEMRGPAGHGPVAVPGAAENLVGPRRI